MNKEEFENKKKEWLSINSDDDNNDYKEFKEFVNNQIEVEKNRTYNNLIEQADLYLEEINDKKENNLPLKKEYINYILKYSKEYPLYLLEGFDFKDIRDIYEEIKYKRKPFLLKLINWIFN